MVAAAAVVLGRVHGADVTIAAVVAAMAAEAMRRAVRRCVALHVRRCGFRRPSLLLKRREAWDRERWGVADHDRRPWQRQCRARLDRVGVWRVRVRRGVNAAAAHCARGGGPARAARRGGVASALCAWGRLVRPFEAALTRRRGRDCVERVDRRSLLLLFLFRLLLGHVPIRRRAARFLAVRLRWVWNGLVPARLAALLLGFAMFESASSRVACIAVVIVAAAFVSRWRFVVPRRPAVVVLFLATAAAALLAGGVLRRRDTAHRERSVFLGRLVGWKNCLFSVNV
mmetsp:Transcript_48352/g.149210  ORF Transcript_48352/g.149210 Transcript_48352/m.149210 type:complete len:285 (-) Transcript_48352:92-946(-)